MLATASVVSAKLKGNLFLRDAHLVQNDVYVVQTVFNAGFLLHF